MANHSIRCPTNLHGDYQSPRVRSVATDQDESNR